MAVLLGRMGGHGKGPDELGLIEAATQVDAQTCTLRLELAYRHRLQLHTVRVVAGRRRIILCRCGCVGLRSLKESLDGAWQRPVREELVVIIPHAAFVEAAAASGQAWAIFLDGLARVIITQPVSGPHRAKSTRRRSGTVCAHKGHLPFAQSRDGWLHLRGLCYTPPLHLTAQMTRRMLRGRGDRRRCALEQLRCHQYKGGRYPLRGFSLTFALTLLLKCGMQVPSAMTSRMLTTPEPPKHAA